MTIEQLRYLKKALAFVFSLVEPDEYFGKCPEADYEAINGLIEGEIERQSVTDEDVQKAIKKMSEYFVFEELYRDDWIKAVRLAIEALKAYKPITGETSDGYHTFNELYEHRTALFAALCNTYNDRSWKSFKHADGSMYDGMFIAGIETPKGQYTYHCDEEYLYMFAMTREVPNAPEWDGHKPSDYNRLFTMRIESDTLEECGFCREMNVGGPYDI